MDVLALVLLHDEKLVEQAVEAALSIERPSRQHVMSCLNRMLDKALPEPLKPPLALKLVTEPLANTARYDDLREGKS